MIENLKIVAAITLFSLIGLTINRVMLSQGDHHRDSAAKIFAAGRAQQVINDISILKFDEATVSATVDDSTNLTLSSGFGLDSGESDVTLADDVDDYHGYQETFSSTIMDSFQLQVSVRYVDKTNLIPLSGSDFSFLKEVKVIVWNDLYMIDSLRLTLLSTYYE